jgi:hypothetical protein
MTWIPGVSHLLILEECLVLCSPLLPRHPGPHPLRNGDPGRPLWLLLLSRCGCLAMSGLLDAGLLLENMGGRVIFLG